MPGGKFYNKITSILLLTLLLLPMLALAASITPVSSNSANTDPSQDPILRLVITENLKTREDLKSYIDQKITEEGKALQQSVDENFGVLDQRLNDFAIKLAIKLGIIWFSTTFLSILTVEIFFRKVYARAIKSRRFQEENTPQTHLSPDIQTMVVELYDKMVRGNGTPVNPYIDPIKDSNQEAIQANIITPIASDTLTSKNPAALSQTTTPTPNKPGFFQRLKIKHQQKKTSKQEAKHQKKLLKETQKIKKQLDKEQKIQEIKKIQNPPTPPKYNPNTFEPDKSYVDHTHSRIQEIYERQKIDNAHTVNPHA